MTASNHTVSGAIIGALITNPILALPVAFFSHFLLDMVPHYTLGEHKSKGFLYKLAIDIAIASSFLLTVLLSQPEGWPRILACSVAAASPDLLWFPYWVMELKGKTPHLSSLAQFLVRIQTERAWGIFVEVPFFLVMLLAFFQLTY